MENKKRVPSPQPSLSSVNPEKMKIVWNKVQNDVVVPQNPPKIPFFNLMSWFTIMLPPLEMYPADFAGFLKNFLLDKGMQDALEKAKILNWCRTCKPLYAVSTTGDGNCLLHAVSLGMWGVQDETLFLRRLIYVTLVDDEGTGKFKQRWMRERAAQNEDIPGNFRYNTGEWEREWDTVVRIAKDVKKPNRCADELPYESLEEAHIFVLANILRRPIIILCDSVIRNIQEVTVGPNYFGGIYLPLLWKPQDCEKSPIVLAFDGYHFTPLASAENAPHEDAKALSSLHAVPLVTHEYEPLTVHFLLQEEERKVYEIMQDYMKVIEVPYTTATGTNIVLSAKLQPKQLDDDANLIPDFIRACESKFQKSKEEALFEQRKSVTKQPHQPNQPARFTSPGYDFKTEDTVLMRPYYDDIRPSAPIFEAREEEPEDLYSASPEVVPISSMEPPKSYIPSVTGDHCQTPGCAYMASVKTHPYCRECAEKIQKQRKGSDSTGEQSRTASKDGKKCIQPGCQLYGCLEQRQMCSKHFEEDETHLRHLHESVTKKSASSTMYSGGAYEDPHHEYTGQATGTPSPATTSLCKTPGCRNPGDTIHYDGLCTGCFVKYVGTPKQSATKGSSIAENPLPVTTGLCKTPGCLFTGSSQYNGYCSQCFKDAVPQKSPFKGTGKMQAPANVKSYSGMCLTPGCQFNGSYHFEGLCSQCHKKKVEAQNKQVSYPVVEKSGSANKGFDDQSVKQQYPQSMLNEVQQCRTIGCEYGGNPQTKGYCSQCYVNHGAREYVASQAEGNEDDDDEEDLTSMQILAKLPASNPEERSKARRYYKCVTSDCNKIGHESTSGLCTECYVRFYRLTHGSKKTQQQPPQHKPDSLKGQDSTQRDVCATQGCCGVRLRETIYCFSCSKDKKHGKQPFIEASAQDQRPRISQMKFSKEPAVHSSPLSDYEQPQFTSLTSKVIPNGHEMSQQKCTTEKCSNFGYDNTNGLCQDCFNRICMAEAYRLQSGEIHIPEESRAPDYEALHLKCITPGCNFFGTPNQNGYCHKCLMEKIARDEVEIPTVPATRPPVPSAAKHCNVQYCDRFGDPAEEGYCHEHYMLTRRSFDVFPSSLYPEERANSLPSYNTYEVEYLRQPKVMPRRSTSQICRENSISRQPVGQMTFEDDMLRHATAIRSSTGECKGAGCSNYGNSRNRGYCNSCFPVYNRY
ncbi:LOW QUALITY PROTEIN: tumor necrosis factor alpha-induced protein 3-like [Lingula anatina]|uniref:ubiquitinyl hydrolase 1 n=1 Tax=Lingula anatina TaxID=7574 RepID=A0A1S3IPE0_LINAN|nr:LOW QUALITY PROTEIN: tumor necrosis factor alpha-induced protein 3-like [Lingula anatina]|eukprot:XP_013399776.1 LOW QUALITY PROTEIN: tumor necrosis factor alpha-induced protein 3-like [Lingula anatina]